MTPTPVPPPRGGNATPVPVPPRKTPKRKKPKTKLPPPPGRTPPGGTTPPPPSPFPSYQFPAIYNPAQIQQQAQTRAQNTINQQLAAGMSALPTVEQQSAPYQQQIASEQGLGSALLDALKGAQTYRVNLATGVPQAFTAEAATTGGDQSTAARAAATLASYGTSAANQIAQQEATAPAATAANTRIIQQRLQDLLSGPQGHDALARQLTSQIEQQRPAVEANYLNQATQQAQIPFQEALQLATANTNYDLAQQTYGLNQQNAQATNTYRQGQLDLAKTNARLRELGLKLQTQRASDSYNLAISRLKLQAKIANQRTATAQQRADATAAQQGIAALTRAKTQLVQQANTLYKRTTSTSGKPASEGTTVIHYTTVGPPPYYTLTPHSETVPTSQAQKRYDDLLHSGFKNVTRTVGTPATGATGGEQGQSVGYLRNQAVNYGVNLILQTAPWIPRAAATRMVQQLVNPIFGGGGTASSSDTPPAGYPRGHTYPTGP